MDMMVKYTLPQWLLLFFIYSFLGWIWECCYVSARVKKWTNRGFMHGPMLPIYGSGAICLLFSTLPVRNSVILTYVVSLISATALEFVTGTVMEALFKVRYWDYSKDKFNYKGQICARASFAWGVGGVLLVFVLNRPFDTLVRSIPGTVAELIALLLTVIASVDYGASFREAMDVREIMIRLSEEKDRQVKRLEKRVDVMAAVYGSELNEMKLEAKEKIEDIKESSQEYFDRTKEKLIALTDGQRVKLNRFISANPEAESKHRSVSFALNELKDYAREKGSLLKKTFEDKEKRNV